MERLHDADLVEGDDDVRAEDSASEETTEEITAEQKNVTRLRPFQGKFDDWAAFDEAFDEYQEDTHQEYRQRSSISVKTRNTKRVESARAAGTKPFLFDESLVYYHRTLICTHGWNTPSRGTGKRSNHTVRGTKCSAALTVALCHKDDSYYVEVKSHKIDHNHPLGGQFKFTYAENRRIDDKATKAMVERMAWGGAKKQKIAHFIHQETGIPVTSKDVANMIARSRSERTGEADDHSIQDKLWSTQSWTSCARNQAASSVPGWHTTISTEDRPLTTNEKYKKAFRVCQRIAEGLSDKGSKSFASWMLTLEKLEQQVRREKTPGLVESEAEASSSGVPSTEPKRRFNESSKPGGRPRTSVTAAKAKKRGLMEETKAPVEKHAV